MDSLTENLPDIESLRRRIAELEALVDAGRERFRRQLEIAAEVHRSLLPSPVRHRRIEVDVRYLPVEEVGGDYCQVRFPDEDHCYITMCDVTGHGIGPGLLATRVSSHVRYNILQQLSPSELVADLNSFIWENFGDTGLYLTFLATHIDLDRRRITWSGAGHPSPLLVRRDRTVEQLNSQNLMVGVLEDCLEAEPQHTASLKPGDRIVLYTDGVTETEDAQGAQLGVTGLAGIAAQSMSVGLFQMADYVLDRVAEFQDGPTTDDKTLIVAEIK